MVRLGIALEVTLIEYTSNLSITQNTLLYILLHVCIAQQEMKCHMQIKYNGDKQYYYYLKSCTQEETGVRILNIIKMTKKQQLYGKQGNITTNTML